MHVNIFWDWWVGYIARCSSDAFGGGVNGRQLVCYRCHRRFVPANTALLSTEKSWLGTTRPSASLVGTEAQLEGEAELGSSNPKLKVSAIDTIYIMVGDLGACAYFVWCAANLRQRLG